jgi:hypothetical protein
MMDLATEWLFQRSDSYKDLPKPRREPYMPKESCKRYGRREPYIPKEGCTRYTRSEKMTPKSKRKSQTKPQKQRKRGEITQRKQTMHQCRN